jgi:hypothetical protein
MSKRIVIYTAISADYDTLNEPEHIIKGADYICFTDKLSLKSTVWNIQPLPNKKVDVVRRARFPKLLPHRLFPDHEISIWVDGSMKIKGNLLKLMKKTLAGYDIALCRHCRKRPSLAAEVDACLRKSKDDPKLLEKQLEAYSEVDPKIPICETGLMLRRHLVPKVKKAMESWWKEILRFSNRDQVSFPYIVWKHKLSIKVMEMRVRSNPWTLSKRHMN